MPKDIEPVQSPTIIVILGGTGDLAQKKLFPALLDLHAEGLLPTRFRIVGFARKELSDEAYRDFVKDALKGHTRKYGKPTLVSFLESLSYRSGDFDTPQSYAALSDHLIEIESAFGQCANKLFYLAVPPPFYHTIFRNLADSGLTIPCSDKTGWTRILVEKPFGNDIATAQELDKTLGLLFKEEQIFRIDHYLGKETLQDILTFRFSNLIFEPLWNNTYIEKVEIVLHESAGVGMRGSFYDGVGALRDVGQNHILQMLAAVAMENPGPLDADAIRKARADTLKALRPISPETATTHITRGQYDGYREERGVAQDSQTETYFRIKAFVDTDRFRDVPFYLESGKGLNERKAEIRIYFRETESCLCPPDAPQHHQNILTFRVQPNEGISVLFWAKKVGFTSELEPKELSFLYNGRKESQRIPDAYERILFDSITGDQILFASTDEVAASWGFITPILAHWRDVPLTSYKKGGAGPETNIT